MEQTPSCSTYYSSCSYTGPSALRHAIKQLTLQSSTGRVAPPVQRDDRASDRRQIDPSQVRDRLPQFLEAAAVPSQPLLKMRTARSPRHMPAAPHIKLSSAGGRRMPACARDGQAVGSCVQQNVIGDLRKVRSTSDGFVLVRKRLSARIRPLAVVGSTSGSEEVKQNVRMPPLRRSRPSHGWTEGSTLLMRGEESVFGDQEERRESSVASFSGDDTLDEEVGEEGSDVYCCAEEELTDLEGEEGEGDLAEDPFSTSAEGVVRVEAQCSSRLEVKKLSPPEETVAMTTSHPVMLTASSVATVPARPPSSLLTPSLFPGIPPTIHFPRPDEKCTPLPPEKKALLKWKMSTITPNVVKSLIARVGFATCSKGSSWLGYWGKHMKEEAFRSLKEYQKVNHFPGTFQIGRKDRLWKNLSRMQLRVGKKECDFVPLTFVLPQDLKKLKREWEKGGTKQKWILKPPAAARGIGIRLACKWSQIPKKRPVVVQKYISNPFLINGSKFDMRIYAYVSSYDPLRIYVFKDGLARFATCKYSTATRSMSNRFMHLTNYSVNKKNTSFTANSDETVCQGHKWGLLALWQYMRTELSIETDSIWESVKDIVVKTIICSEPMVASLVRAHVKNSASCHELFGFDVILDKNLKAWILEVNISPSLHSTSQLDLNIKGMMMADLFNIAGFRLPTPQSLQEGKSHHTGLSVEERAKHFHFTKKHLSESEKMSILDSLTPDDLKVLMTTEDEFARCGSFERVYPSVDSPKYHHFFENERYYNLLLEQWTIKYHKSPKRGIALLQRLAQV